MKKIISILLLVSSFASAGEVNLDFGLRLGQRQSSSKEAKTDWSSGVGFVGLAGYWSDSWMIGIQASGGLSDDAKTFITTNQNRVIQGNFNFRSISYGPIFRFYFTDYDSKDAKSYIQIGATLNASEVHRPDLGIPTFDDDEIVRVFLRGHGFLFTLGHEFENSPFFIRTDYIFERFDEVKILLTDDGFNSTISNEHLNHSLSIHAIYFTFGFSRVF